MAALLSSRQTSAPTQQLTPPSSSHGGRGSWDYAVPVNDPSVSHEQDPYMAEYVTSHRQPLTSQANGFAKPVRSPTWSSQDQHNDYDQPRLIPDRANDLHKKPSRDMNTIGSDQDSVMEYYKTHANNKKGPTAVKGKPKKKPTKAQMADPNWSALEHDQNNWIHRDKLKEIETRELEEAGFRVGRSSRSNSRSQSATRRARSRTNSESLERTQTGDERQGTRKVVSPIPAEDEELGEGFHSWSPSTPGEVPPELQPSSPRTGHTAGRPSTSRIPLPKTSGIPVPSSLADRDAPLSRSRAGSASWNENAIAANGARVRSGSVGSQVLLDDHEDGRQKTPPYARGHARSMSGTSDSGSPPKSPPKSPMKAKTPPKPNPTSGSRKTSVVKNQPKNRTASATSPRRPGTSGGTSRPTTAHRPEGEAPWIATMYKPDPRLPPDQQIIPTHAKRMQQEQWENQGRPGSMYDKDFRQLNDDAMADQRLSQLNPIDIETAREQGEWPLPSPTKEDQLEAPLEKVDTNRAKSPGMEYRLTPSIPQGARSPSPKLAPPIAPPQPKPTTTRVPEPPEEEKEKKGCCCIVM
ncbi:40S ribosomal protein S12 [Coniothyrium glycines]